jgi:hypothetical protein
MIYVSSKNKKYGKRGECYFMQLWDAAPPLQLPSPWAFLKQAASSLQWRCLSPFPWGWRPLLLWPFKTVYMHGPRLWGGGCWEGAPPADVCAGITGVPSSFWDSQADVCADVIERRVTGIAIAAVVFTMVGSGLWVVWAYTHYRLYVLPWLQVLQSKNMVRST